MANENNYTVPFGIDSTPFFNDINKMEAGMDSLSNTATQASGNMQKAFNTTAQSADKLDSSINANVDSVKILQAQAAKAGADIANQLSGKGIDTAFSARVDAIKAKLKTISTQAINVNVDFPEAKIEALENQIKGATDATAQFNAVLSFAKEQLAGLEAGSVDFGELNSQIQTAEKFIEQLNTAIAQTLPVTNELGLAFASAFDKVATFLTPKELQALDTAIEGTTTDAEALTAQVTALSEKLATLKPNSAEFQSFTEAVTAGNAALESMGVEVVNLAEATEKGASASVSYRTQLRLIREELAGMYAAGLQNTAEFQALADKAGTVGNAVMNASKTIKELSSNTFALHAGVEAVTALSGAFIAAQGAISLFGGDSKKAQQTVQGLYTGLAALQGLQMLATIVQKDSALSLGLLTAARKLDTVFATQQTVAVAENAVAVEGEAVALETAAVAEAAVATETVVATGAFEAFTVALLANPIGLIVLLLAAASTALLAFATSADKITDAIDRQNIGFKNLKENLDDDVAFIQGKTAILVAQAQLLGQKGSDISAKTIDGLQRELNARKFYTAQVAAEFDKISKIYDDGNQKNDDVNKQFIAAGDKLRDAQNSQKEAENQIAVAKINQQTEANKESVELDAALLAERNSNFSARKQIEQATIGFVKDAHKQELDDLTDTNDKALQKIKDAGADRVALVQENINNLKEKIKENNAQVGLIGEQVKIGSTDPALGAKQIADLKSQNALIAKEVKAAGADILAITEGTSVALLKAQNDFANKRLDLQLSTNLELAKLENDGYQKDADVLRAQFLQRQQQIITQYANNKDLIGKLLAENTAAYAEASIKLNTEATLKQIDQDTQLEQLRLQNTGKFAADNEAQQQQLNIKLLEIQLEGAKERLALLVDDGTKESEIAIEQAKDTINKLENLIKGAKDKAGQTTIFSLLGLDGLSDDQKKGLTDAFNAINKSVNQITSAVIAGYKAQIEAKQTLIDANETQLQTLTGQLQTEQQLKDKGLANNLAGIQAEIDATNNQITTQKAQQAKLIEQSKAAQREQAAINAAIELGNLVVAASNIFKTLSGIPYVGVALAIVSVAAMTAGFIASQIAIGKAINAQTSASFEGGGFIEGRKHRQGGQKYRSIDGTGNVVELQAGEFVVRDHVADKYANFLEALNSEQLTDDHLREFLQDTGVSLSVDAPARAVKEYAHHEEAKFNYVHFNSPDLNSEDIASIRANMQYLADRKRNDPERWEDTDFYYTRKGNNINRVKK
jgi:chromosome segregation ATPase